MALVPLAYLSLCHTQECSLRPAYRCKHKHIEHDPATHACSKPACQCQQFDR
mgnify:CR=1 FL=1